MGGQLSSVAGGDFSNFSLVNSVNGMTNQIAKDPNVLNAVSSAARYRKDLETIQKLKEKGDWAESNQLEYNKEVDAWYNNEDLNSSYSANVSPYVDVQKDAQDIIKGLAKDEYNIEVMQDPTTGRYYDIMTNQEVKELTPEKIQTALKAGLSPQAWRQLSLDGKLKYSNVSELIKFSLGMYILHLLVRFLKQKYNPVWTWNPNNVKVTNGNLIEELSRVYLGKALLTNIFNFKYYFAKTNLISFIHSAA